MKIRRWIIVAAVFAGLFVSTGYMFSDDAYFGKILKANQLTKPDQVFAWVIDHYAVPATSWVHTNATPGHLMQKHSILWCDEGSIVTATLCHKLGYKTHLLDLYGFDNISHHTVMQVWDHEQWVTYDFTARISHQTPDSSARFFHLVMKEAKPKSYPNAYNFFVNNNYFLKKIALWMRGIDESNK
jgi:hypothetical protein